MFDMLKNVFGTFAPETDPFNTSLYDPRAAQRAAVSGALKGLGVGLMSNDWGRAAEMAGSGVEDYERGVARKAALQDLMFKAEENRQRRAEEERRNQWMEQQIAQLPADQQALARMMPDKYFGNMLDAQFSAPADPSDKYKVVGGNLYDVETGQWVEGPGGMGQGDLPKGYRWKADGTGAEPIPGVSLPGTQMRLTEQQSKDLVYYQRGESAAANLDQTEQALTNLGDSAIDALPGGNIFTSKEYQVANQAGREFLAAILRKDTGAAITAQEMDVYGKMYLPKPGDKPEVLAQKKQARRVALDAIKNGLGAAQKALPQPTQIPDEVTPEEWDAMTEEERALWQ